MFRISSKNANVVAALCISLGAMSAPAEHQFTAFFTGYSFWNNTSGGSVNFTLADVRQS